MKYAAYEQYKPSRTEWIGAVPEHWEIWKIAHGFQMTGSGTTPPPDNPDWYDGNVCWVTTSELRETVITDTEKKISQEALKSFSALKVFPEGALAIAMYGATIGRLGIFGIAAATNQACGVLFGQKAFDTKFVFYWLQAFREQIILLASGGGQPNISQEKVRSVRIACPSIEEQQTITRFLDAKTARIDELIAKKRQLIDKLKEKRSALIARTVTRGLPPEAAKAAGLGSNPEMKDSGVEWLGAVPTHWTVLAVRRVAKRIQTGSTPPTTEDRFYEDGTVPWFGPGSFSEEITLSNPIKWINRDAIDEGVARLFAPNSTMIVCIGATLGRVSSTTDYVSCNQQITVVEFDVRRVYPKFGTYQLKKLEATLREIAPSATLPILSRGDIGDIFLALPPLHEQKNIASFIERETTHIDRLIKQVNGVVLRLTEYRQALITSAVTGKVNVCNLSHAREDEQPQEVAHELA